MKAAHECPEAYENYESKTKKFCNISRMGGGKIEHLILCRHSVKTFAAAKVHIFFELCKKRYKNNKNLHMSIYFRIFGPPT